MPNHVHGILILNDWIDNDCENKTIVLSKNIDTLLDDAVKTTHALSLHPQSQPPSSKTTPGNSPEPSKTIRQKRFQNQGKNSVSSIIGSYKSAVSKHTHRLGFVFAWQERFYDNIIRDEESFQIISNYIANNPVNWKDDRFFPIN